MKNRYTGTQFRGDVFGGTPTQVSGPTGPMTVVLASAVFAFPDNLSAILAVIFLAGVFQIRLGLLKVGVFVRYIPYPVISSFMSGIGVIIILIQLHPLLGAASVNSPMEAVLKIPGAFLTLDSYSLILAFSTMAIVFFTPARISAIFPSPLIALLAGTLISITFKFPIALITYD